MLPISNKHSSSKSSGEIEVLPEAMRLTIVDVPGACISPIMRDEKLIRSTR